MPATALIVVDCQNDFMNAKGSMYVDKSETYLAIINRLIGCKSFDIVCKSKDWHPTDHRSFKTMANAVNPVHTWENQWAPHCIQGTWGADFVDGLETAPNELHVTKSVFPDVESFSAFGYYEKQLDGSRKTFEDTRLYDELKSRNVDTVVVCGCVYEYCVKETCISASELGFRTILVEDATAFIAARDRDVCKTQLKYQGIRIVNFDEVLIV